MADDVRAKLRASINGFWFNGYPPDKQPEVIKLVMERIESMAPRLADARSQRALDSATRGMQQQQEKRGMTTYESSSGSAATQLPPTSDHAPQLTDKRLKLAKVRSANGARLIFGSLLALLPTVTWLANNPGSQSGSSPSNRRSDLSAADLRNTMNNGGTRSAPQQKVVNGWCVNDISAVIDARNTYIAVNSARNGNLLVLLGLGMAGELVIRGTGRARINRRATA